MRRFRRFACVDWSGARGERQKGIAVALCDVGTGAPRLLSQERRWSRQSVLDWLIMLGEQRADILIGFDFSASLPFDHQGGYFPGWTAAPDTARALWRFVDDVCANDPHLAAGALVDHPDASAYFRRSSGRQGAQFGADNGRLRLVERRCRDAGLGPAQSCFNLVGAAQVGKSSLTGMRMLHRLAGRVPIWPFDDVPPEGPLIVEVYTTIAARAAGMRRGSKLRSAKVLDAALARLNSARHDPLPRYDDHSTDAIVTAAWLRSAAGVAELWSPACLDAVRHTEGWTFGVR